MPDYDDARCRNKQHADHFAPGGGLRQQEETPECRERQIGVVEHADRRCRSELVSFGDGDLDDWMQERQNR